jgi:hypothetical protein
MARTSSHRFPSPWRIAMAALAACAAACLAPPAAARAGERFDTPEQAVQALVAATRAGAPAQLLKVLGSDGRKLVFSGDAVADKLGRERFVAAYDAGHEIERQGADRAVLALGEKRWPFPIPIVEQGAKWRYDTRAGAEEILDRRIGRDELSAIEVCRAYVDAQREYAATVGRQGGLAEYAQHFKSNPGKRDGLYWPVGAGEAESPMGPLVASARAEGYPAGEAGARRPTPYHGYFYRILKAQGPHAADGARSYVVGGRMVGGFALVAFPARYGDSGVMTFVVNQDGVVYQKNLGPRTAAIARRMEVFDPDPSWSRVPPPATH